MSSHRSLRSVPSPLLVLAVPALLLAGLAGPLDAQEAEGRPAEERKVVAVEDAAAESLTLEMARVHLPSLSEKWVEPYTIEVPVSWVTRRDLTAPGPFLGPATGSPDSHPAMLLVRESDVDVSNPHAVLFTLRENAERGEWALMEGEVRDYGAARGLWIVRKLPPSGMHGERVNVAAKVPLGTTRSLDVVATVPADEWQGVLRQQIEHMLASIRPAEAAETPEGE